MKDISETTNAIGIEKLCDRSQGLLGLSWKAKFLERFKMDKCLIGIVLI